MQQRPLNIDVLVVGAGPTGLTAAILLHRLGLRVRIVDQRGGPQRAPAAHAVNARSFEVWRQAGVNVDLLRAAATSPRDAAATNWVTKLGGNLLGSLPYERQGDEMLAVTPTPLRNLSQHRLEPLLVAESLAIGIDVEYSTTWVSSVQGDAFIDTALQSASGADQNVRAKYLLACDGAGSPIRRSLGIQPIGPAKLQQFLMVQFEANLRTIVAEQLGILFFVMDPESNGVFVAHDVDHDWVYMHPFDSDVEPIETFTTTHCEALVRAAMVPNDVPMAVKTVSAWTMTSQVVDRYQAGRIFLVGDSAHRFPPTGGLGLNTGVQDAHNLAWKIAAVLHGTAGEELLDSYEAERRPVAINNGEQSLTNAFKMIEVPIALGTDPDVGVARNNMDAVLASAEGRASVAAAIANQAAHFDMIGLQLGMIYGDERDQSKVDVSRYEPSSTPGGRLPHAWVIREGRSVSTLDLIPLDRYVVFLGPDASMPPGYGLALQMRVDRNDDALQRWWTTILGLNDSSVLVVRPDQHIQSRQI